MFSRIVMVLKKIPLIAEKIVFLNDTFFSYGLV